MNHYETDDGKIVVDVMKFDVAPLFPLPDGSPLDEELPPARLTRWTFDLDGHGNTFREEQLDDRSGEFPRFDERFCMSDYRHGWIVAGDVTDPKTGEPRQDGLVHYDLKTGKSTAWSAGKDDRFGEPIFVPRSEDARRGRRLAPERALSRRGKALAISRSSRRPTSPRARSPWRTCRAACRQASTATGGRVRCDSEASTLNLGPPLRRQGEDGRGVAHRRRFPLPALPLAGRGI